MPTSTRYVSMSVKPRADVGIRPYKISRQSYHIIYNFTRKVLSAMEHPHRKSPRLPRYDYSSEGAYFITICVKDHIEMLGKIALNPSIQIHLSEYGIIVEKYLSRIEGLDKYIIMPNHIHLIIRNRQTSIQSIPQKIRSFKTLVSKEIGFSMFQRSYNDHIIRTHDEYLNIWKYIDDNPVRWATERCHEDK